MICWKNLKKKESENSHSDYRIILIDANCLSRQGYNFSDVYFLCGNKLCSLNEEAKGKIRELIRTEYLGG